MSAFLKKIRDLVPFSTTDIQGEKRLMLSSFPYYLTFVISLLSMKFILTDAWIIVTILYIVLPVLDDKFSLDTLNPTSSENQQLQRNDIYFKIPLFLTIITDWILFFQVMNYFRDMKQLQFNLIGIFFVFFNNNAFQFLIAHQIFHKQGMFNKFLGTFHMCKNLYMHFTYEHLYGHHRRVATPEDPATAQKGISFYQFFPRSFFGSYKSVYLMQRDEQNKPFYLNYAVLSVVSALIVIWLVWYYFGGQATILFVLCQFFSIQFLQSTNYIEHYGLRRKKLPNGEYQKVTIRHSWNAAYRITNYSLFKLQRHSDHHQNSLKPYQQLLTLDESPHLPHCYSLMLIMSFFPKIWFRIMDPLVDEYQRTGNGSIKNEVTVKAIEQTKKFGLKMQGTIIILWIASFLI